MCGIIGAAGDIQKDVAEAVQDMLIIDQLRGLDGTGVFTVGKYSGNESMFKLAVDASTYVTTKRGSNIISSTKGVIIGHNRAATRGELTNENSHPFKHGHITGVHNGTLVSCFNLPDNKAFDVDSDNLYYAISKLGVDEAIKLANGAYALVWWNSEESTLNLLRNSQRPLYYAYTEGGKCLLWASEAWMIIAACGRRNVKLMENPKPLPEMRLLSIKVVKDKLEETSWRTLTEYSYANVVPFGNSGREALPRDKYQGKRVRACLIDYRSGCFLGYLADDTSVSVSMYVPMNEKKAFDDMDSHMGDIEATVSGVSHTDRILYLSWMNVSKLDTFTSLPVKLGECAQCGDPFTNATEMVPLEGYPGEHVCKTCDSSQMLLMANKH